MTGVQVTGASTFERQVMELWDDHGLGDIAIAEAMGASVHRVRTALSNLAAGGKDVAADAHFQNIREGSAQLLARIIAVHGPANQNFPPANKGDIHG